MDKNNSGFLSYNEFTLLLEEKWRGLDPTSNLQGRLANAAKQLNRQKQNFGAHQQNATDAEKFHIIENLAKSRTKFPLKA